MSTSEIGGRSVVLQPGEGRSLSFFGLNMTYKVTSEDTNGAYVVFEFVAPPHMPGPPPHIHENCDESFYVLEGTMKLRLGDEVVTLGPGGFGMARRGTVHNPENGGDVPLKVVTTLTPGGFEPYFDEVAELAATTPAGPPPREKMAEIAARYGVVWVTQR